MSGQNLDKSFKKTEQLVGADHTTQDGNAALDDMIDNPPRNYERADEQAQKEIDSAKAGKHGKGAPEGDVVLGRSSKGLQNHSEADRIQDEAVKVSTDPEEIPNAPAPGQPDS